MHVLANALALVEALCSVSPSTREGAAVAEVVGSVDVDAALAGVSAEGVWRLRAEVLQLIVSKQSE